MHSEVFISALSGAAGALVGGIAALSGVYLQDLLQARRKRLLIQETLEGELQAMRYLLIEARWGWVETWKQHNICQRKRDLLEQDSTASRRALDAAYDDLRFWQAKELNKSERLDDVLRTLHPLLVRIRLNFAEQADIGDQCTKLSQLDLSNYFVESENTIDAEAELAAWQQTVDKNLELTNNIWQQELDKLLKLVRAANKAARRA